MIDHSEQLEKWLMSGKKLAIARVVSTWRSSPRPAGSSLIITEEGDMMGSVSGGCVENAVVKKALEVMTTGKAVSVDYGVENEDAWEVGLSCGGRLSVFIQPFLSLHLWHNVQKAEQDKSGRFLLTRMDASADSLLINPDETEGIDIADDVRDQCTELYRMGKNATIDGGDVQYFLQSLRPKPRMLLVGSAHISSELTSLAHTYGFETILVDPRDTFAKKTHYESAPGAVYVNWPQEVLPNMVFDHDTYVVILSHDPKIDDEALKLILRSDVRYIGALGSRKTHAKRVSRLQSYGFSEDEIARIHAPIGISINSHSAAEIALSIMAEVIQVKNS